MAHKTRPQVFPMTRAQATPLGAAWMLHGCKPPCGCNPPFLGVWGVDLVYLECPLCEAVWMCPGVVSIGARP